MSISKESFDFLFDTLKFYDDQYNKLADNCYNEINRALNEISNNYLSANGVTILPIGSYALKNNYQLLEPMEFFAILPGDRAQILLKEGEQKKALSNKKKKHLSIKELYSSMVIGTSNGPLNTALDVSNIIAREIQKYLGTQDKVYFRNNIIFLKIFISDEVQVSAIIYVVYNYDKNGVYEFQRLGYNSKENTNQLLLNIQEKNLRTNGNYLVLCKLIKMLELELIINGNSDIYLSKKTLFVENILYNVPDSFYLDDDYNEIFLRIINYLKQCDASEIKLPDGNQTSMFKINNYYANSNYKSFIKKLVFLYFNTDSLISNALNSLQKDEQSSNINDEKNSNLNQNDNQDVKMINKNID